MDMAPQGSSKEPIALNLEGTELKPVETQRLVGVLIDQKLT
jgi:hypothetical protein